MSEPRPLERLVANLARWDRAARLGIGILCIALPLSGAVGGLLGVSLLLLAWIPLVTGAIGWCPFYSLLGISTRRRR